MTAWSCANVAAALAAEVAVVEQGPGPGRDILLDPVTEAARAALRLWLPLAEGNPLAARILRDVALRVAMIACRRCGGGS